MIIKYSLAAKIAGGLVGVGTCIYILHTHPIPVVFLIIGAGIYFIGEYLGKINL